MTLKIFLSHGQRDIRDLQMNRTFIGIFSKVATRKVIAVCSLLITLAIPLSSHAKEAFEYSDTELKEAGWSQIQIDQMRQEHRKSSSGSTSSSALFGVLGAAAKILAEQSKQPLNNQSQDTKLDPSLPKVKSDSNNLKPPGPDYLDNNRWAGVLKECCRIAKPTILPATIVFSGDQAELDRDPPLHVELRRHRAHGQAHGARGQSHPPAR